MSNGDLEVNNIITKKIKELTPEIPIIWGNSWFKEKKYSKNFFGNRSIDGTKEYIGGKDEYTLNAALVIDTVPVLGLVGAPKKKRLFYTYAPGESFWLKMEKAWKINYEKTTEGKIVAVSSAIKPSDVILNKLKENKVNLIVKIASSYKFCVIATGEFDIYAARERANEWDTGGVSSKCRRNN